MVRIYALEELLLNLIRTTHSREEIDNTLLPLLEELLKLAEHDTISPTTPMRFPAFRRGSRESWTFFLDNLRKTKPS